MARTLKRFQIRIKNLLQDYFDDLRRRNSNIAGIDIQVETEWKAFRRDTGFLYSPFVDIAVGPFAVEAYQYSEDYTRLINASETLVTSLLNIFESNYSSIFSTRDSTSYSSYDLSSLPSLQDFTSNASNDNARCLFAIEIEKSGSRKHRLGDLVNAAALGRMGILVAWDEEVLRSFFRILQYFKFLNAAGKPTLAALHGRAAKNIIILTMSQLDNILAADEVGLSQLPD